MPQALDAGFDPLDAIAHADADADGGPDAGRLDLGPVDAATPDAAPNDADLGAPDADAPDAGAPDADAPDAVAEDAGPPDLGVDAGFVDSGPAWSAPSVLHGRGAPAAASPVIARLGVHDALALWSHADGTLAAARYDDAAGSWTSTTAPHPLDGATHHAPATAHAGDSVLAAWRRDDGGNTAIVGARFSGGWSAMQLIDGRDGDPPSVGGWADGTAIAAWSADTEVRTSVFDGSWAAATQVDAASRPSNGVVVATGTVGVAVAAWRRAAVGGGEVWAARLDDRGWGATFRVNEPGAADVSSPRVAMAPSGDVILAWVELDAIGESDVVARRLPHDAPAGSPERFGAGLIQDDEHPRVTMDAASNGMVVWHRLQITGQHDIFARRFWHAGLLWRTERRLNPSGRGSNTAPAIALHDGGYGIAVWQRAAPGGASALWSSGFDGRTRQWSSERQIPFAHATGGPEVVITETLEGIAVWTAIGPAGVDEIRASVFE